MKYNFLTPCSADRKPRPGFRFCETCQSYKPKDKTKAIKGWKCTDCRFVKR